ncbi:MAG: hypothetical protein ACI9MC_004189 [Kiritimatiellia bacterium]|jgi:hypothetical protein
MEAQMMELAVTWGLGAVLIAVALVGVAALPWRARDLRATAVAWQDISRLSGTFARDGMGAARLFIRRAGEIAHVRPTALSRTLS